MSAFPRNDHFFWSPFLQQKPKPLEKTFGLCVDHWTSLYGPPHERRHIRTALRGEYPVGRITSYPSSRCFRPYRCLPFRGHPCAGATIQDAGGQSSVYFIYRVDPWRTPDQPPLYVLHHFPSLSAGRDH